MPFCVPRSRPRVIGLQPDIVTGVPRGSGCGGLPLRATPMGAQWTGTSWSADGFFIVFHVHEVVSSTVGRKTAQCYSQGHSKPGSLNLGSYQLPAITRRLSRLLTMPSRGSFAVFVGQEAVAVAAPQHITHQTMMLLEAPGRGACQVGFTNSRGLESFSNGLRLLGGLFGTKAQVQKT